VIQPRADNAEADTQRPTRYTRSPSPPIRVQRRRVIRSAATIPASNISPYMCSVSGPRWTTFVDGEGRKPIRVPADIAFT